MILWFPVDAVPADADFQRMLQKLELLANDMRSMHGGVSFHKLIPDDAPTLHCWKISFPRLPKLVGYAEGHPDFPDAYAPITTSQIYLLSNDLKYARTLSRWYKLGQVEPSPRPKGFADDF